MLYNCTTRQPLAINKMGNAFQVYPNIFSKHQKNEVKNHIPILLFCACPSLSLWPKYFFYINTQLIKALCTNCEPSQQQTPWLPL